MRFTKIAIAVSVISFSIACYSDSISNAIEMVEFSQDPYMEFWLVPSEKQDEWERRVLDWKNSNSSGNLGLISDAAHLNHFLCKIDEFKKIKDNLCRKPSFKRISKSPVLAELVNDFLRGDNRTSVSSFKFAQSSKSSPDYVYKFNDIVRVDELIQWSRKRDGKNYRLPTIDELNAIEFVAERSIKYGGSASPRIFTLSMDTGYDNAVYINIDKSLNYLTKSCSSWGQECEKDNNIFLFKFSEGIKYEDKFGKSAASNHKRLNDKLMKQGFGVFLVEE